MVRVMSVLDVLFASLTGSASLNPLKLFRPWTCACLLVGMRHLRS